MLNGVMSKNTIFTYWPLVTLTLGQSRSLKI